MRSVSPVTILRDGWVRLTSILSSIAGILQARPETGVLNVT